MIRRLEGFIACFCLILGLVTVLLQNHFHQPDNLFQPITIGATSQQQFESILAEQSRHFKAHQAALVRRAHLEITTLTILSLSTFYVLYRRCGTLEWSRGAILASAAATVGGLLLAW